MNLKDRIEAAHPGALKNFRAEMGDEAADKVNAILAILRIGDRRSVAYSKAILAAAEMALDRMSCFAEPED